LVWKRPRIEIHARHHSLCDALEHLLVRPLGLRHEVMQCLVAGAGMQRIYARSQGLSTLLRDRGSISPVQ
jgi:hypothetical protein